ncbi:MAG: HEAT repeat domain-containing protein [Promethearchaeota archaeon]
MTTLSFDERKIEKLIINGNYDEAADSLFTIIEHGQSVDSETLYKALSLLNHICDKTPSISLKAVKFIHPIIDNQNSWVRLVSLEILYQISMYRPNLLIESIDKIRARFYDHELIVRRLAVKIIGNLILLLHIEKTKIQDLVEEFAEKLLDSDWKVKLQVIKTLKQVLNQDFTKIKSIEPLLSMTILNLRDEDEDVARSSAELLKILGLFYIPKDKMMYILLNLLFNEEHRVKELIIWLFGEFGKEKSFEIIPFIPKLINLLKENDYRIQIKVIDALVNISHNNFDQIWSNLVNVLYTADNDLKNTIINALYHLAQSNISEIFEYLFEGLENPSESIRNSIAIVLKRLYEEYQVEIENEITKMLYKLESKYWRERQRTIILLRQICFILNIKKIAVWIFIELEKSLKKENDSDVKTELIYTLKSIKNHFKGLEDIIFRINSELELFTKKIVEFRKLPAKFREKMNTYIKEYRFDEVETELNKTYRNILKKIKNFNRKLDRFEYKRLAYNLLEDWEETKIQIIDELSIIKGFILDICEEKKQEFTVDLKYRIKIIEDKINILKAQYEIIKNYEMPEDIDTIILTREKDDDLKEKFTQITQMRSYLFKLDDDIRELILNNVEFDLFKGLLSRWVETKIKIQEFLSDLDKKIKLLKDKIIKYFLEIKNREDLSKEELEIITNELGFQLFQGHIQLIINQAIDGFKKFNDSFPEWNAKVDNFIKKNKFSDAKKFININQEQIQSFIEDYENQIERIVGKNMEDNEIFNLYVRPYFNKFTSSKELLINKLKYFVQKNLEKLYYTQIKYYLEVMNPIKLENLATYMDLDLEYLKNLILKFIHKNKLNGKIIEGTLYSPRFEDIVESKNLLLFKNIKTIGNKMYLNFKLSNPSNVDFRDLQISLKIPSYLTFMKEESFPTYLYINKLKSGNVFTFNYVVKINKEKKKNLSDPKVDEITLNIFYKDPFNITRKTSKKIDLLLP